MNAKHAKPTDAQLRAADLWGEAMRGFGVSAQAAAEGCRILQAALLRMGERLGPSGTDDSPPASDE